MRHDPHRAASTLARAAADFRLRFGRMLGIDTERKNELYIELSRGATLNDLLYWLQIFFSAGIATLGLVMNSPAVIIGAMLISPLMGPILGAGLALSSGDVVLGLRSITKIVFSCALAVALSVLLVLILPFREMTDEIAARTRPNTLDLIIALFSGAVGSLAVSRDVKGVATSIPGVAIAVALMPPLCVTGYGLGLMLTRDPSWGWRVASGGGLLFLTNLVTITFTAMLVFLAINLNTRSVMQKATDWERSDAESVYILSLIDRFPRFAQAREIRSLPIRFLMILLPLVAILVPLSRSFDQMQAEIAAQRRENSMRNTVTSIWQDNFAKKTDGTTRSTIDKLSVSEKAGQLNIAMRVLDDEPYTTAEKKEFARLVANGLARGVDTVSIQMTEIPTTKVLAAIRERNEQTAEPSVADLQASLTQRIDSAISDVEFPPNAQLVSRQLVLDSSKSWRVNLTYLCETTLEPQAQDHVIREVRHNLNDDMAEIRLDRIEPEVGLIEFPRGRSTIPILGMIQLDYAGRVMRDNEALTLIVSPNGRDDDIDRERVDTIAGYLDSRWHIARDRIALADPSLWKPGPANRARIAFRIGGLPGPHRNFHP